MEKKPYKHESIPKDKHWEKHVKVSLAGGKTPDGAFLPKLARERPTPHITVNECDH